MFTRRKALDILKDLQEIDEELSDVENSDSEVYSNESDEDEIEMYELDDELESDSDFEYETGSDSELEDDFSNKNQNKISKSSKKGQIDEAIEAVFNRYVGNSQKLNPKDTKKLKSNEFLAKDGTIWQKLAVEDFIRKGPASAQNVFTENPGLTSFASKKIDDSALSAFLCIIDKPFLKIIVDCTNEEAKRRNSTFTIDLHDVLLFVGVLFARGLFCQKVSIKNMWSKDYGTPLIKEMMTRNKFYQIMKYLRFDDKSTRHSRISIDKFALARDIWERFISNSQSCFKPDFELTIDEQLLPCKTRCPFIQFMPNKPDKFGIKFWLLCDVKSKYVCNGYPYLGKQDLRDEGDFLGESVIKKLTQPYLNKGYHVTADNYFSSRKAALYLLENKTSFLGTLKGNKREIPILYDSKQNIKNNKLTLYSSEFYRDEKGCLLTLYQGKTDKNVLILSTLHDQIYIDCANKKKPNTVISYNTTKFGVDAVDNMTRLYNVKSATRRWPVQVFYNILNLAGINSWILFKKKNSSIARSKFLSKLIKEIIDEAKKEELKMLHTLLKARENAETPRKKCQIGFCNGNKTENVCFNCNKRTCGKCLFEFKITCKNCASK
jgi:hypothetical protein